MTISRTHGDSIRWESACGPSRARTCATARILESRPPRPGPQPPSPLEEKAMVRSIAHALRRRRWLRPASMLVLAGMLSAAPARAAPDAGRPACDYCRMIFEDPAFGAAITLRSGQRKIYDAVECMAAAVLTDSVSQRDIRAISLVDHDAPHERLPLARAAFLQCRTYESPMGLSLAAFPTRARASAAGGAGMGRVLDWRGGLAVADSVWVPGPLSAECPITPSPPQRTD